jgi:hypothetical protein
MRFCAAHMRVRINERGQVNMRTAYDICGFFATENPIFNPFEPPHIYLYGSSRHRRSNYFKILEKCIVRGGIRTPYLLDEDQEQDHHTTFYICTK